ncbi:DUF1993 family protein [Nitratireductor sp. XY-223]|uniref:DUF1993 family protein n=1 Tax=Nitratireductor sp. XY-223 TaxID=2561926 RepID=UPI0010AA5CE8|nr:DUF1993 family protein [Nitratireductor sp. XY-223]
MPDLFADATTDSVKYYLDRIEQLLLRVSDQDRPQQLLDIRLAPDMFDTGLNLAIALQFAARALCPPANMEVPEIPGEFTTKSLLAFKNEVESVIKPISARDLCEPVSHQAGSAQLEQDPAEYLARFAFPNMIFHLSLAYAGLRHGGMNIGKADFDGLHRY